MRKSLDTLVWALALLTASCSKMEEPVWENGTVNPQNGTPAVAEARVFYGATPSYGKETKTALDADTKMYWQSGDLISVFQSATNEQYRFNGEDGDCLSAFVKNDESVPGAAFSTNYALYPWAAGVASATEGTLTFTLPDTQPYAVKSFAQNANPMVSVTANSASNEFIFQNLCAFLQLRIYGDATVRRIRFRGNNNEVLCGDATVTVAYGSEPSLALSGEGGKVLTLDCGEGGITLGATAGDYTPVWLVVPPIAFTKGFTFEIERVSGEVSTKSTAKSVSLTRGHAQPMAAFRVDAAPKALTGFSLSDGVHSYNAFEITDDVISVQVPNQADMSSMVASFTFEGAGVSVGGVPQESGVDSQDFSDFNTPVEYVVTATDASTRTYSVRMFNLPVVTIDTPGKRAIVDKVNWIEGTKITIRETASDGNSTLTEYGASVKGRGNATWNFEKKPYAIKLDKKAEVLGMAKHKRWVLMTHVRGFYFSNPIGFELSRRSESMEWAPSGRYVDLILNGDHRGCYYLAEQIKIDPTRVNITEMKSTDIAGEALTGGYLLTYDITYDERYKFRSAYYNMPVMFKDPDPDPDQGEGTLPDEQFNYLQDYINTLEASLKDAGRLAAKEYLEYIDVDTYIDQYFVWELAGRYGWKYTPSHNAEFTLPRSVWFHKDRGGKLKAGPVWDFDVYFMYYEAQAFCNEAQYYKELFSEPSFVARVKEKWPRFKARLEADGGMEAYLDSLYNTAVASARRDRQMWAHIWRVNDPTPDEAYPIQRSYLTNKIAWMDSYISSLVVNYDNKGTGTEDYGGQGDKTGDFGFGF